MVMEFMKGGDFSSLLEGCGGAFDEDTAKYFGLSETGLKHFKEQV